MSVVLATTLLTGWSWDQPDTRKDTNDDREERRTSAKRGDNGFWGKTKRKEEVSPSRTSNWMWGSSRLSRNPRLELEEGRYGIVLKPEELPSSQLTIDVDRYGGCWISNQKVTPEQIRRLVKDRYLKYLDFPCLIRADRNTQHKYVREVMTACLAGQIEAQEVNRKVSTEPKISFVALAEAHENKDVYSKMVVFAPSPSEEPDDSGPWYAYICEAEESELQEEPPKPPDVVPPPEDAPDVQVDTPNASPVMTTETVAPVSNEPQSFKPALADSALLINSPVKLPGGKGFTRDEGHIGRFTGSGSKYGDSRTEVAVMKALRWLKLHQNSDGSWPGVKPATTGFAILTYLAHGETPDSPEFGRTVERALNYLMGAVHEKNGKVVISGADGHEYAFLIAMYALTEAYAMTRNPNLKVVAEKGLTRIVQGQSMTGGWDYNINFRSTRDDLSFAGWALQALKAGKMAGLHVNGMDACIKRAIKCLQMRNFKNGGFNYVAGGKPTGLTATGCFAMQLLGQSNTPQVMSALKYMQDWKPTFDKAALSKEKATGSCPQYYCYYATRCKYLAGMAPNAAPENQALWKKWNAEMKALYPRTIIDDKNKDGSPVTIKDPKGKDRPVGHWVNKDAHTTRPVMDTCLTALQLMVYYRYLPTTKLEATKADETMKSKSDDITVTLDL